MGYSDLITMFFVAFFGVCVYNIINSKPTYKGNVIDFKKAKNKRKR